MLGRAAGSWSPSRSVRPSAAEAASPCPDHRGDDAVGGDSSDPVVEGVEHVHVARTIKGRLIRLVQPCRCRRTAIAGEGALHGPGPNDGGNETGLQIDPPDAMVGEVRHIEVPIRSHRNAEAADSRLARRSTITDVIDRSRRSGSARSGNAGDDAIGRDASDPDPEHVDAAVRVDRDIARVERRLTRAASFGEVGANPGHRRDLTRADRFESRRLKNALVLHRPAPSAGRHATR